MKIEAHVARVELYIDDEVIVVQVESSTYEDACKALIEELKKYFEHRVCIGEVATSAREHVKMILPAQHLVGFPEEIPEGHQLLIFEQVDYTGPYSWNLYILPFGEYMIADQQVRLSVDCPAKISTNLQIKFSLPDGTREWLGGELQYVNSTD